LKEAYPLELKRLRKKAGIDRTDGRKHPSAAKAGAI
jgi:hypothetical protein